MDEELKTMVLSEVDNTSCFAINNIFAGYMVSSTKYIMNHLMDRCEQITAAEIYIKKKTFKNHWIIHNQLTPSLSSPIIDCNNPARQTLLFIPKQALKISYNAVISSGIYIYAHKYWCENPGAEKIRLN